MSAIARRAAAALALLAAAAALGGCSDEQPTRTAAPVARARDALPSPAAQEAAVKRFAEGGRPVYCGGGRGRLIALTFDDGPGPYTHIVLRELRRAGAHATFFVVGTSIERFPRAVQPERAATAAIGEHTMTHADLRALSLAAAHSEIARGRAIALQAAGPPVDLFRPPYGRHSAAIDQDVRRQGMAEILWSIDSADSRITPPADFHEISAQVRRAARPGAIVLMHENRGQTVRALRSILPALKRRGLQPVTIPELLAADPPTTAQLEAGARGCEAPHAPKARAKAAR